MASKSCLTGQVSDLPDPEENTLMLFSTGLPAASWVSVSRVIMSAPETPVPAQRLISMGRLCASRRTRVNPRPSSTMRDGMPKASYWVSCVERPSPAPHGPSATTGPVPGGQPATAGKASLMRGGAAPATP